MVRQAPKDTRIFNGEQYVLYAQHLFKRDAEANKKKLMQLGWKVRVVNWGGTRGLWLVYYKQKMHKTYKKR